MRPAYTALIAVIIIIVVIAASVGIYLMQYDHLKVDVDEAQSGLTVSSASALELLVVLVFENTGSVELVVPPTSFDVWADGVYAGPGESEGVKVPAGAQVRTTARIDINVLTAPQAYYNLADDGEDRIRLKGEAHVDVLLFTLDFPFDETFTVDA